MEFFVGLFFVIVYLWARGDLKREARERDKRRENSDNFRESIQKFVTYDYDKYPDTKATTEVLSSIGLIPPNFRFDIIGSPMYPSARWTLDLISLIYKYGKIPSRNDWGTELPIPSVMSIYCVATDEETRNAALESIRNDERYYFSNGHIYRKLSLSDQKKLCRWICNKMKSHGMNADIIGIKSTHDNYRFKWRGFCQEYKGYQGKNHISVWESERDWMLYNSK